VDIDVAQADTLIPWIANAIAVAMGYTCHPSAGEEPRRPAWRDGGGAAPCQRGIGRLRRRPEPDARSAQGMHRRS